MATSAGGASSAGRQRGAGGATGGSGDRGTQGRPHHSGTPLPGEHTPQGTPACHRPRNKKTHHTPKVKLPVPPKNHRTPAGHRRILRRSRGCWGAQGDSRRSGEVFRSLRPPAVLPLLTCRAPVAPRGGVKSGVLAAPCFLVLLGRCLHRRRCPVPWVGPLLGWQWLICRRPRLVAAPPPTPPQESVAFSPTHSLP